MVENLVGKSKKEAQDYADKHNLIFRLVSIDGEKYLGYPADNRNDRVCVEIEKNKVSKATIS